MANHESSASSREVRGESLDGDSQVGKVKIRRRRETNLLGARMPKLLVDPVTAFLCTPPLFSSTHGSV